MLVLDSEDKWLSFVVKEYFVKDKNYSKIGQTFAVVELKDKEGQTKSIEIKLETKLKVID